MINVCVCCKCTIMSNFMINSIQNANNAHDKHLWWTRIQLNISHFCMVHSHFSSYEEWVLFEWAAIEWLNGIPSYHTSCLLWCLVLLATFVILFFFFFSSSSVMRQVLIFFVMNRWHWPTDCSNTNSIRFVEQNLTTAKWTC